MAKETKNQEDQGTSILSLVLVFVLGFTAFTFVGFVILVILLSLGILPAY